MQPNNPLVIGLKNLYVNVLVNPPELDEILIRLKGGKINEGGGYLILIPNQMHLPYRERLLCSIFADCNPYLTAYYVNQCKHGSVIL